ncbi:MAG: hypothetical protein WHS86_10495 [Desulfosoma sp.]
MILAQNPNRRRGAKTKAHGFKTLAAAFVCLMFLPAGWARTARADSVPELEARFLQMTQALRAHPAETIAALFPETRFPLQEKPFFQTLAAQGMPRFVTNEALSRTAADTAESLMAQAEGGSASFDLPPLAERFTEHGYPAVEKGEIVTGLTFRNFVQPEAAAEALFRQVLARELAASNLRDTVLLNPYVRDVGVSCRAGKITVNGVPQNAYVLVVDAGAHILHDLELHLFQQLNRWRRDPGRGIFPVLLSTLTGNPGPFALEPVPVVLWNAKLYEEVRALASAGEGSTPPDPSLAPTEAELLDWLVLSPPLQVSVPLDVSMGVDQLTAAAWQGIVQAEAARWAYQASPYALSPEAFGGAVALALRTGEDGTIFLDITVLMAARPAALGTGSRLAGTVLMAADAPDSRKIQEVRLVSVPTQEIKASAVVDPAGGFYLGTVQPLYPPFVPYELVFFDAQGLETARRPLPVGLDGVFLEVLDIVP